MGGIRRPGAGLDLLLHGPRRPGGRRRREPGLEATGTSSQGGAILHVLLVEDNEDHAALVERGLAGSDGRVRIVTVRDGEEALAYLRRQGRWVDPEASPRPGLVLLDLRLPRLDGFGVLRTVKQSPQLRSIPVVVLTTTEASSEVERAYALRANSYLVKPVDFDGLVELMGALARFWLEWNRGAAEPDPDPG